MTSDSVIALTLVCSAPFIGSFLAVLAIRLPQRRPVIFGRSCCDSCGQALAARDLIPILSGLLLGGRCRKCDAKIDALHPILEALAIVVACWAWTETQGWIMVATCGFGWLLLALAAADWRGGILPNSLNALLGAGGLATAFGIAPESTGEHVAGAAIGFTLLAAAAFIYRKLRGREGLGLGDAKLLAAIGAWVSWQGLASVVLYGSGLGLAYVALCSMRGKPVSGSDALPFGPFLAMAGWLVWLYGPLLPA